MWWRIGIRVLAARCRCTWESRFAWGTGDSEMPRYEPFCRVARPCGTVQQLERVVSDLLAMDR